MIRQRLQMNLPQPQLVSGDMGGIDDFLDIDRSGAGTAAQTANELAPKCARLAIKEAKPVTVREGGKVLEPVAEVAAETPGEGRPPPGEVFVTRIGRRAVE